MDSLQALNATSASNAVTRRDFPVTKQEAVATDIRPPADSLATTTPQVVSSMGESTQGGIGRRPEDDQHSREDVEEAVNEINDFFQSMQRTLEFKLDEKSERMVIQVKDAEGKVLKQIPPEQALELARRLDDFKGVLLEEQA